jgi:REP element-mobilizing transposase RayT
VSLCDYVISTIDYCPIIVLDVDSDYKKNMARARKRHVQIDIEWNRRGGRRKGAGRKRVAARPMVPHRRRPALKKTTPAHVTLRVVDDVKRLRRMDAFKIVRRAMIRAKAKQNFRIVHLSLQGNHIHLVCEADDRMALSRGIQGFKISAAKKLNSARGRDGEVFTDRYHEEILHTPAQVRNAINYCLNNWRKHREDRNSPSRVDPYSTGMHFDGWCDGTIRIPEGAETLEPSPPSCWLLREGWKKGRPISLFATPGSRA